MVRAPFIKADREDSYTTTKAAVAFYSAKPASLPSPLSLPHLLLVKQQACFWFPIHSQDLSGALVLK